MQSFRTELENPVVEQDIYELERKIRLFKEGSLDEERFRSLRLARGVYGQRQPGVQMIRIKLPYGKMTVRQLRRIADVSDEYSNGNLHFTTRQDIQIHYVSLDRTPELWTQLEKDDVTLREACGNTVRNVTASPNAGIDPQEPFDVTPYAHKVFEYFLRNPICQDMGRKFKIAFSSSEADTAYTFMHDLGFIPTVDGDNRRGFRVVLGGGLGSQPALAVPVYDFLPTEKVIPFTEGVLRVFDRHGERKRRLKARIKFLIKDIGIDEFLRLVHEEQQALTYQSYPIDPEEYGDVKPPKHIEPKVVQNIDPKAYDRWLKTNVSAQKQKGFFAVKIKARNGNMSTETARKLATLVEDYAADDIRVTIDQGVLLKYVRLEAIEQVYSELSKLGLSDPGAGSTGDVTSCPGTDTCNLGISNSTSIALVMEDIVNTEYPELQENSDIRIKLSGCMNSCGQHSLAAIGFHGSTLKIEKKIAPALQVLLGGGVLGNGEGQISEKIIKVPSKRGPDVLREILDDYLKNSVDGEHYYSYFNRQGKMYFYELLKPYADVSQPQEDWYVDWGHDEVFKPQIGIGECAGAQVDLVATLFDEAEERFQQGREFLGNEQWADAIYSAYTAFIHGAKALLTAVDVTTNTQANIIKLFDEHLVDQKKIDLDGHRFSDVVYQIRKNKPSKAFATSYMDNAQQFLDKAKRLK